METNEEYRIDRSKVVKDEAIISLHRLFIQKLREVYASEKAFIRSMPVLGSLAADDSLKTLINEHQIASSGHLEKIEFAFYMMGEQIKAGSPAPIGGLLRKIRKVRSDFGSDSVADAAIASILVQVIHLLLAMYETLTSLSRTLGKSDVAAQLHEIMASETEYHDSLSEIMETIEMGMLQRYTES